MKKELYMTKLQELKELGEQIISETKEWSDFEDEVRCMNMHFDCSIKILTKAQKKKKKSKNKS